ncbi:MAG: hypothetical protein PHG63_00110, partial [Candidatus Dojkabacteria bacterium]|nr:hypothetical protein [Candidatus Dojkabacteria bacterium]
FGSPRRLPTGIARQRLEMLCAVLSRRAKVDVSSDDVYVSVIGGMTIDDPAADLAVCMAIVSSKLDVPLRRTDVYVGEVGLSGEVRPVAYMKRVSGEAKRRGLSITGERRGAHTDVHDIVKSLRQ